MSLPVPILLITGYLGAGKTTLLNRLIAYCQSNGIRPALVVNDFGQVNVDGRLVQRGNFTVAEIAGGCICCSDPAEIADAVQMLAGLYAPDWIVIETSGLAEPLETVNVLTMPETVDRWRVGRVVAVVDAERLFSDEICRGLTERQAPFADLVVLNKADLVDERRRRRAEDYVRKLNPRVVIRPAVHADVVGSEFFGPVVAPPEDRCGGRRQQPGHGAAAPRAHAHNSFQTMAYSFAQPVNETAFRDVLAGLAPGVVRSKGFVRLAGMDGIHRFQTVDRHVDIMRWPDTESPPLVGVFIGQGLSENRLRDALTATAARPEPGTPAATPAGPSPA